MKINWKDYVYYETDKELDNHLNSIGVAYFKNNRWQIYLGFQSPEYVKTMEKVEALIDEAMEQMNVERSAIKLVRPPNHIECEEIGAATYVKKIEVQIGR